MTGWQSQRLDADHDCSSFGCGQEPLDRWLKTDALRAQNANTARTYVWTAAGDPRVVAYYSIAPTLIQRDELSGTQAGGYTVVPAYLLARLALDQSLKGQGLGSELLIDALEAIAVASDQGGGRLIVVDAIDDRAASFYRHHDFVPVKGSEHRLVIKVATVRKSLGMARVSVADDRELHLSSMVLDMPDGTSVPIVMSPGETAGLLERLEAFGQRAAATDEQVRINLRDLFQEVLGRDPFSESGYAP